MTKKIFTALLAFLLSLVFLVSCDGDDKQGDGSNVSSTSEGSVTTSSAFEEAPELGDGAFELPIMPND